MGPLNIFVRRKSLGLQPIGGYADLDYGVRLNIRPIMSVSDVGRRGAGVLWDRPNVNRSKARDKDVQSAPWCHRFKGDRINDYHLSLKEMISSHESQWKGV